MRYLIKIMIIFEFIKITTFKVVHQFDLIFNGLNSTVLLHTPLKTKHALIVEIYTFPITQKYHHYFTKCNLFK